MASFGLYAPISKEEGEDVGMITKRSAGRTAPTGPSSGRISWWKYVAAVAAVLVLAVPVIAYTFSVMLEHRVAAAVQDALANQPAPPPAPTCPTLAAPSPTPTPDKDEAIKLHAPVNPEKQEEPPLLLSNGTEIQPSNTFAGMRYELRDCGSNADEARALGCSYDVMMQEWTPPECIDWTLSEKYLLGGNWTWYADPNAETVYDNVEVALGNHQVVYVDQSYHRHHCIFAWERLVRAMRTQRPMIEKLINYDHFHHCRMNTLKTFEEGAAHVRGVVAPTGFTKCASYDVWLEMLPAHEAEHVKRMVEMF